MPLYEYQCESCGSRFERIQKFSDPPVETCPSCDGPVRKLLSSPAIQFKGSGWYITDYARKSSSSDDKGSSDKGGTPASADAGKSGGASAGGDSKPAPPAAGSGSASGSS